MLTTLVLSLFDITPAPLGHTSYATCLCLWQLYLGYWHFLACQSLTSSHPNYCYNQTKLYKLDQTLAFVLDMVVQIYTHVLHISLGIP